MSIPTELLHALKHALVEGLEGESKEQVVEKTMPLPPKLWSLAEDMIEAGEKAQKRLGEMKEEAEELMAKHKAKKRLFYATADIHFGTETKQTGIDVDTKEYKVYKDEDEE